MDRGGGGRTGGGGWRRCRLTYYPDITQGQPEERVREEVEVFAAALANQLSTDLGSSITIDVPPVMEVPEQFDDIVSGGSAIGLLKPVAYVFAHHLNQRIVTARCAPAYPGQGGDLL